jgi:hypothetical protein
VNEIFSDQYTQLLRRQSIGTITATPSVWISDAHLGAYMATFVPIVIVGTMTTASIKNWGDIND